MVLPVLPEMSIDVLFFHHNIEWYREYRFWWLPLYSVTYSLITWWIFKDCILNTHNPLAMMHNGSPGCASSDPQVHCQMLWHWGDISGSSTWILWCYDRNRREECIMSQSHWVCRARNALSHFFYDEWIKQHINSTAHMKIIIHI